MYTKKILNRFQNPKFAGEIKKADAVGEVGNVKCLLPNEKILIDGDFLEINKSNKRDIAFSHNLKNNIILKKFLRNYRGRIITLKNLLGQVSLTEDHLVYAIKLPKHDKYFRTKYKKELVPAWYHASELEKRDIALYPVYNVVEDRKQIHFDIPKSKWDFKSKKLPNKIPLNNDFLRLCGYFLAEGHISEGMSKNFIQLAFNIKEKGYIEDVKKIAKKLFDIDVTIRLEKSKNTAKVYLYSADLARFFKKLFSNGAKNKSIPKILMKLPPNKQKSLLEGLWKGDGYVNISRICPRAGYATISFYLSQQTKILLLRQRIVPSIYIDKEKKVRGVYHKEAYRIHVGQMDSLKKLCNILKIKYNPKSYEAISSWFDNGFLFTPITEIARRNYKGKVCNLEVDRAHSFISEAFCLHNCGDIMRVYLKIEDNKIEKIRFKTYGCVAAIASTDYLCEIVKGKTLDQAVKITSKDVVKRMGKVPAVKLHCSVLAQNALKKAIEEYKKRNKY